MRPHHAGQDVPVPSEFSFAPLPVVLVTLLFDCVEVLEDKILKLAAIKFVLGDFVNDAHRVFTHRVPNDVNAEVEHIPNLPNKQPLMGLHGHDPQQARTHHHDP